MRSIKSTKKETAKKLKKVKKISKILLTFSNQCDIIPKSATAGKNLGVAQLVARYLGVVEAARSSRVTQTRKSRMSLAHSAFSDLC